jgi:cytochrome c5
MHSPIPASAAKTVISGTVRAADGGFVNGVVLIEKGRLYGKDFRYGGLIVDGSFSVPVDGGGSYGLHLYATSYIYFPLGIQVGEGQDNSGQYKLPPNPAADMAPVIEKITFERMKRGTRISLTVTDPNKDLSHQVLALNAATGEGFRMQPPSFVLPFSKTYPEGTYTLAYEGDHGADPETWYFVAADNKCYNSPVLGYPFSEDGIMQSKSGGGEVPEGQAGSGSTLAQPGPSVAGQDIFRDNCSMCHLSDSKESKVGPGLKGLYSAERTPVLGNPVNDEVIRRQILEGGKAMPPYSHLTEKEVMAVMEYLKGL